MAAPGHATWHADISMTSLGGSGLLTSVVGPADVSVDQSTLTGQQSKGQRSVGPAGQPHPEADRWAPGSGRDKREKEKGFGLVLGTIQLGRLGWLNKAWLSSAHGSAWPAAQQAGSGSGLAGRAGRLGLTPSQAGFSPPPAG
jgi:hypothetical protein